MKATAIGGSICGAEFFSHGEYAFQQNILGKCGTAEGQIPTFDALVLYVEKDCDEKWGTAGSDGKFWRQFMMCLQTYYIMCTFPAWKGVLKASNATKTWKALNTVPQKNHARLNLALYTLLKEHEHDLPKGFFKDVPDYRAIYKLPLINTLRKILVHGEAITAWCRTIMARRATIAVAAAS